MRQMLLSIGLAIGISTGSVCYEMENTMQTSEVPVRTRVAARTFPSVFQAWNRADNLGDEEYMITAARHDLIFHGAGFFELKWNHSYEGLAWRFTPDSIAQGMETRRKLLTLNPKMVLILEVRYRDASQDFFPEGYKWWRRDSEGNLVKGWEEGDFIQLDFSNPEFRDHVAQRAEAAMNSGVVDGIMLDWWNDDDDRVALIKAIRERIGDEALILANSNDRKTPRTAPYINGYFMECYRSKTPEDWERIADTLSWAEKNLREPRINCLETWFHNSRDDLNLMRATTTLSLTLSSGYCLFSDPNPLPAPDHLHNWYDFWDVDLGKPVSEGERRADGSILREFTNGTVLYNPMGNGPVTIRFEELRKSVATGAVVEEHELEPADGDIYLKEPSDGPSE